MQVVTEKYKDVSQDKSYYPIIGFTEIFYDGKLSAIRTHFADTSFKIIY